MFFINALSVLMIIGYVGFGLYFLMNAYSHLFKSSHLIGYAQFKGVKSARFAVLGGGILLLVGGLGYVGSFPALMLAGPAHIVTLSILFALMRLMLVVFLIPVSIKMHAFWKETDPQKRQAEHISFFKNMALAAAVLMTMF